MNKSKEPEGLEDGHWVFLDYKQRCTRKTTQNILINHPTIIFKGRLYNIKSKHIGAGVYEVYKEERSSRD
jgi:hypothetical protein